MSKLPVPKPFSDPDDGSKLHIKMDINRTDMQDKLKMLEGLLHNKNFAQIVVTVLNKNAKKYKDLQKSILQGRHRKSRKSKMGRRRRRRISRKSSE